MLRRLKEMENYSLLAKDGPIGEVKDFYFDDEKWVIRYLIVDTGNWLASRKVLVSPLALGHPDWTRKILPVSLTREQVKNCPGIDTDQPVSRQYEQGFLGYYGYPYYWGSEELWAGNVYPNMMMPGYGGFASMPDPIRSSADLDYARDAAARHQNDDPHLRSCKEVAGYHVHATDGDIGHIQGFLVDQDTWAIRYIIVDTSNWWLGHQVLIAPVWLQDISRPDTSVSVALTRQAVKDAPAYDPTMPIDRHQEARLHEYYGHSGYWEDEVVREGAAVGP